MIEDRYSDDDEDYPNSIDEPMRSRRIPSFPLEGNTLLGSNVTPPQYYHQQSGE